jgi:Dolichyl-phosphate-mannose-protein mannosyltransferase
MKILRHLTNLVGVPRPELLIFSCVWLFSAVYLGATLKHGWVPHDEGILSQAADRVLHGELPHRDFDDPYTGGLSYVNALAFRTFGENLSSLRYVLFLFFLTWIPAVYTIARAFFAPWPSAGITLLAVLWSVPNYPAAMPSWYCLFFTTFGVLAGIKYVERPRSYLLILAGLAGGFSFLVKSPGILFVAGTLLFFVYREQSLSQAIPTAVSGIEQKVLRTYVIFLLVGLLFFLALLTKAIMVTGGSPEFFHFVLPPLAIVCLLLVRERDVRCPNQLNRFRILFSMVIPFFVGLAAPIGAFVAVYWRAGALKALENGLFVLHLRRVAEAQRSPLDWDLVLPTVILAIFLTEKPPPQPRPIVTALKIISAVIVLAACLKSVLVYMLVIQAVWEIVPVLAIVGSIGLHLAGKMHIPSEICRQKTLLLLSATIAWSLVQFPFSAPIYFCYVAPLSVLTMAALLSLVPRPSRTNFVICGAFFAVFALFFDSYVMSRHFPFPDAERFSRFQIPRAGGIEIPTEQSMVYSELISVIRAADGRGFLAAPDCPEVYFLSGTQNPTRFLLEFLEDPLEFERTVQYLLDSRKITFIIIHEDPQFSKTQRNILINLARKNGFIKTRTIGDFAVYQPPVAWQDNERTTLRSE